MAARSNLSTSSSEQLAPASAVDAIRPMQRRRTLTAVLVALALLAAGDRALNSWLAMPTSNLVAPTALQLYFDYGRSVESKLRRMAGAVPDQSAPIAQQGWLSPGARPAASKNAVASPMRASASMPPSTLTVAVYGQSFIMQMADLLPQLEPRLRIISRQGAPAAPLSHSYAAYLADMDCGSDCARANIVLVGILASSLPRLVSLSNMTAWCEAPTPYTYPRYRLSGGKLSTENPLIASYAHLHAALQRPAAWRAFSDQLRASDLAYDAALFESDWLDRSLLARLARRGYGQRHLQQLERRYHDSTGFKNHDGLLDVSNALLLDMSRLARSRHQQLVVVLIGDRGYGDDLAGALAPALASGAITHLSTAAVAPATDTANFVADGHFTITANRRLAMALRDKLRSLPIYAHATDQASRVR